MIKQIVFSIGIAMFALQAHAWTAVAHSKNNGNTFIQYEAFTAEEADTGALNGCNKNASQCALVGQANSGPGALVVAKGIDGMSQYFNLDPNVAANKALANCQSLYKECTLKQAAWDGGRKWMAIAMGSDGAAQFSYGNDSQAAAKKHSLDECEEKTGEKGSCKVVEDWVRYGHSWIAIARNSESWGIGKSIKSLADAKSQALITCRKGRGNASDCRVAETFENLAEVPAPPAFKKLLAKIEKDNRGSSPSPATPKNGGGKSIRYSTSCQNMNCVRQYEDGRRVSYRACMNPATMLPMNDPNQVGGCGGTDSRGNFFGMKNL